MSSAPPPPALGAPAPAAPPPDPPPDAERPAWPAWAAPAGLVAALVVATFAAVVLAAVGSAFGASITEPPPGVRIAATILQDAAFVAVAVLLARMAAPVTPRLLGLRRVGVRRALKWTALAYAGFWAFSIVYALIVRTNETDDLPKELGADGSTAALLAVAALACVVAPIAEELFFRGFFFPALRNARAGWLRRTPWPAAAITGLVFGSIHFSSAAAVFLPVLAVFGFALCVLYERTGSIVPGIGLHALNNCIAFSATQHWDWQVPVLMAATATLLGAAVGPFLQPQKGLKTPNTI